MIDECVILKLSRKNAKNPYWEYACNELKLMKKYDETIINRLVNV
jgi:hypothetical protein